MLSDCRWQLRMGMGGVYALDYGAVFALAQARGAASPFLTEVLPAVERILIGLLQPNPEADGEEG